jgi:ABC-type multidrug transport system ATPase subunit
MIKLHGVTQHYGVRPVLRDIDMHVEAGELVAIIGPNGMGKSTLLSVMAGILAPQKGFVEITGMRRRESCETELAIRKQVVYFPDHIWLPRKMTGREYLLAVGRLYDVEYDRLMSHIDRLLRLFELTEKSDSPIDTYSNGQQHKIGICSALVTEAPVLLLDEPFSGGLDPSGILALKKVLQRLARRSDRTVVMTTPVPELVEPLADRICVLQEGRVLALESVPQFIGRSQSGGSLAEALEEVLHPDTLTNIESYFEDSP